MVTTRHLRLQRSLNHVKKSAYDRSIGAHCGSGGHMRCLCQYVPIVAGQAGIDESCVVSTLIY